MKSHTCPRCGETSIGKRQLRLIFGFRIMSGIEYIQSHCRKCRSVKKGKKNINNKKGGK